MSKHILAAILHLGRNGQGADECEHSNSMDKSRDALPPDMTVPETELRGTVQVMFATLVREGGLSGGVALSNQECSQGPKISVSIPAGTSLDKALGQVAASESASAWQLRDGVPNLLPAGPIPPLLVVRVPKFTWNRTDSPPEILSRLRQLSEVSAEIRKLGLKEAPIEGGAAAICVPGACQPKPTSEVPKVIENVTLLTALNRIVHSRDGAVWIYSEYRCGESTQFSSNLLAE